MFSYFLFNKILLLLKPKKVEKLNYVFSSIMRFYIFLIRPATYLLPFSCPYDRHAYRSGFISIHHNLGTLFQKILVNNPNTFTRHEFKLRFNSQLPQASV